MHIEGNIYKNLYLFLFALVVFKFKNKVLILIKFSYRTLSFNYLKSLFLSFQSIQFFIRLSFLNINLSTVLKDTLRDFVESTSIYNEYPKVGKKVQKLKEPQGVSSKGVIREPRGLVLKLTLDISEDNVEKQTKVLSLFMRNFF